MCRASLLTAILALVVSCSDSDGTSDDGGTNGKDGKAKDAPSTVDGNDNRDSIIPKADGPSVGCNCNDGLGCTDDFCDTNGMCNHKIWPDYCVIDSACRKKGDKNGHECQVCDPTKSQSAWTPIIGGCFIGNYCFQKGEKDPSGCNACVPSKNAFGWTPVKPDCQIGGKCYAKGEKDPTGCQSCEPTKSSTEWSPAPYDCKIGENCYANGEKHPSQTCTTVECDKQTSSAIWTVKGDECLIGNTCKKPKDHGPGGCVACIPSQSKIDWSPASYDCKIGGTCFKHGDKHPSPTCTSVICDKTISTNNWSVTGSECLIGERCHQPGDKTSAGCMECKPSQTKIEWSEASYDCKIGNICYADGDQHPDPSCTSVVCDKATSTADWTIKGNECFIGGKCYKAGDKTTVGGCNECNPSQSKTSWSPMAGACAIGGGCHKSGDKHPDPSCTSVVCDPATSTTYWTVKGNECFIGDKCYAPGAADPTGCASCNPAIAKTSWVPGATCNKIIVAGLNQALNGNLGGIAGADSKCATQAKAAGYPGTWKAFLSTSTQNVKDLITGTNATTLPVVNTLGQQLYSSWSTIFTLSTWSAAAPFIYTFDGREVDDNTGAVPDWYGARNWTGSYTSGTYYTSRTCNDWTTQSSSYRGAYGDLDIRRLLYSSYVYCSYTLAVVCVLVSVP
jgi:collagen type XVIII alpha/collagen type XV alpha